MFWLEKIFRCGIPRHALQRLVCLRKLLSYFTRLFSWLFAFSGFDFPTRFPEDFFLFCCLALKANGFLLGIISFFSAKLK